MEQRISDRQVVVDKIECPTSSAAKENSKDASNRADAYERMEAYLAKRETLEDEPIVLSSSKDSAETSF